MIFDIKRNIPAISIMCAEPDSNAEIKTQQRLYQPINTGVVLKKDNKNVFFARKNRLDAFF